MARFLGGVPTLQRNEPELFVPKDVKDTVVYQELQPLHYPLYVDKGLPSARDLYQGAIGDCWLLAPILALLALPGGPSIIKNEIIADGGNTFTVRLFDIDKYSELKLIMVTRFFPMTKADDSFIYAMRGKRGTPTAPVAIWPAVIEKAAAQLLGGYARLNEGARAEQGMRLLLGSAGRESDLFTYGELKDLILAAVGAGQPVTLGKQEDKGAHNYAVVSADDNGIVIRDPNTLPGHLDTHIDLSAVGTFKIQTPLQGLLSISWEDVPTHFPTIVATPLLPRPGK